MYKETDYKSLNVNKKLRWQAIAKVIVQHNLQTLAEIGVSRGDNARGVLKRLAEEKYQIKKYYLIDIPYPTQIQFYGKKEAPKYRFLRLGLGDCTYLNKGSIESAKLIADNELDFVWIDADTSTENAFRADIEAYLPKVKNDGVIAGRYFSIKGEKFPTPHIREVVVDIFGVHNINLQLLEEQNSGRPDYMWWCHV